MNPGRLITAWASTHGTRGRLPVALLCLALAFIVTAAALGADAPPGADGTLVFEERPCWFPNVKPGLPVARCGYLHVPESRAHPNGRTVHIAVAILTPPSTEPGALPDPLVLLPGGPGGAARIGTNEFEFWRDNYRRSPMFAGRSLVLADTRGSGESLPKLRCPEIAGRQMGQLGEPLRISGMDMAAWPAAYLACRDRYSKAGVAVEAYNAEETAADFVDLRRALGIERWDLWGTSYGARLALMLMQRDAAAVRSAVLDAPVHGGELGLARVAASARSTIRGIFTDCAADPACAARYPDIEATFLRVLDELRSDPPMVTMPLPLYASHLDYDVVVDDGRLLDMVFASLYFSGAAAELPALIQAIDEGDMEGLVAEFPAYAMMIADPTFSDLVYMNSVCREEYNADRLDLERRALDGYAPFDFLAPLDFAAALCPAWNIDRAVSDEAQPIGSTTPTLILTGGYDPIAPPDHARRIQAWLPESRLYIFPQLGHGTIGFDPCADATAAAFLKAPLDDPTQDCFKELPRPTFRRPAKWAEWWAGPTASP